MNAEHNFAESTDKNTPTRPSKEARERAEHDMLITAIRSGNKRIKAKKRTEVLQKEQQLRNEEAAVRSTSQINNWFPFPATPKHSEILTCRVDYVTFVDSFQAAKAAESRRKAARDKPRPLKLPRGKMPFAEPRILTGKVSPLSAEAPKQDPLVFLPGDVVMGNYDGVCLESSIFFGDNGCCHAICV